ATALATLPDVDVELPVDALARDLDLVLRGDMGFVEGAAAVGANAGQRRLVGGPQAFAGAFTVTTGQGAVRRTCSATLPISTRPSPVRPCVPITIRSHRVSWAAPTIRGAASPFSTR